MIRLFHGRNWVRIETSGGADPRGGLLQLFRARYGSHERIDFDVASYVAWARSAGQRLEVNGRPPRDSNPLPEPGAALLFGAGLIAIAASRRTQ